MQTGVNRRRAALTIASAAALTTFNTRAQVRNMRIIVPYEAGSGTDVAARILAPHLGQITGSNVVVENIVGAGGTIGTAQLVRAVPDGFTLALVSCNHAINPHLYKALPFDAVKDVTPLNVIAEGSCVLAVKSDFKASDVAGLTKHLQTSDEFKEGALSGTILQLCGAAYRQQGKLKAPSIPYRTMAQIINDIQGDVVHYSFFPSVLVDGLVKAGRMKALAVSTRERISLMPNVPTMRESGFPSYDMGAWLQFLAPRNLDERLARKLFREIELVVNDPAVRARLQETGLVLRMVAYEALASFLSDEVRRYAPLVSASDVKI